MTLFERIDKQLLIECEDGDVEYAQAWYNIIPKDYEEPIRDESEEETFLFAKSIALIYACKYNIKLNIVDVSKQAFYSRSEDSVTCPCREQFDCDGDFFCTLFHELVHSTGHKNRLNRDMGGGFDLQYCEEELIAELGAMYLCAICCYNDGKAFEQSATYIKHYRQKTNTSDEDLERIARKAKQAVECILEPKKSFDEE